MRKRNAMAALSALSVVKAAPRGHIWENSSSTTDMCPVPNEGHDIYLTIITGTDEPLVNDTGNKTVIYIGTAWGLTHRTLLHRALLDNSTRTPGCRRGHCFSENIPDTEGWRLAPTTNPEHGCSYELIANHWRAGVSVGKVGINRYGARPGDAVLDFIGERVKTTYPGLEIGLLFLLVLVVPVLGLVLDFVIGLRTLAGWVMEHYGRGVAALREGVAEGKEMVRRSIAAMPSRRGSGGLGVDPQVDSGLPSYEEAVKADGLRV